MRPTTAVTRLDGGRGPLRPWREIPEVGPEVSGVGEYAATIHASTRRRPVRGCVLDLGSTAGGLGSVQVNDGPLRGFDTSRPRIDVTADVRPGRTPITVRVSSSLNNRLLARGYFDTVQDIAVDCSVEESRRRRRRTCTTTGCSARYA